MGLTKILVPLDGSELAEKALPIATSLARRSGADLCLVTIAGDKAGDLQHDDSKLYLKEVSGSLRSDGFTSCFHVESGSADQGIVRTAVTEEIDLIVMTTRGRSGIARGILGSVADQVISNTALPVYIVRSDNAPTHETPDLNAGVIVPLDGSELAETALDDAIMLAQLSLSPIFLLRIVGDGVSTEERDAAGAYLDRLSVQLAQKKVLAIPELMTGRAGESIIRAMENHPNCVVVLTSRGDGGLKRWVRDSVADCLIQRASGPIVVVSPRHHALLGSVIH